MRARPTRAAGFAKQSLTRDLTLMIRTLSVVLGFCALSAPIAQGQHAASSSSRDTVSSSLAGRWEGRNVAPHGEASLVIIMTVAPMVKADMYLDPSASGPAIPLHDVTAKRDSVTWKQSLMGMECTGAAAVTGNAMKGTITCPGVSSIFSLTKKLPSAP